MLSDYLRPSLPDLPENFPSSVVTYTGPTSLFLSPDDAGNIVLGAPLIASSGSLVVGTSATGSGANSVPTGGVVVAGSQGPAFYATADTYFACRPGGYASRVFGDF